MRMRTRVKPSTPARPSELVRLPYATNLGQFTAPGRTEIVMARPGSKRLALVVAGAGAVGALARIFGSDDVVQWEEFGLLRVQGTGVATGGQAFFSAHSFLRVQLDWVTPGGAVTVLVGSPEEVAA